MSSNSTSGSSSESGAIIGGAVGVVILLLMIIVVLCIVILCIRRSHRKRMFRIDDDKVFYNTTKLNTDVTIEDNPSYDITKANTVDYSYDTINPGDSDVPLTTNPSYNVDTKPYSKTSEDEDYIQPNELTQYSDVDGHIKIDSSLHCGAEKLIDQHFTIITTNPAPTKQHDYDYVHDYSFKGIAKDGYLQVHTSVGQGSCAKPLDEGEYGVINQPKN